MSLKIVDRYRLCHISISYYSMQKNLKSFDTKKVNTSFLYFDKLKVFRKQFGKTDIWRLNGTT